MRGRKDPNQVFLECKASGLRMHTWSGGISYLALAKGKRSKGYSKPGDNVSKAGGGQVQSTVPSRELADTLPWYLSDTPGLAGLRFQG